MDPVRVRRISLGRFCVCTATVNPLLPRAGSREYPLAGTRAAEVPAQRRAAAWGGRRSAHDHLPDHAGAAGCRISRAAIASDRGNEPRAPTVDAANPSRAGPSGGSRVVAARGFVVVWPDSSSDCYRSPCCSPQRSSCLLRRPRKPPLQGQERLRRKHVSRSSAIYPQVSSRESWTSARTRRSSPSRDGRESSGPESPDRRRLLVSPKLLVPGHCPAQARASRFISSARSRF